MKATRIREILKDENPEAVLLEGMDEALLGINRTNNPIGVYSYLKSIELLIEKGLTEEEALDIYEQKVALAQIGDNLPLWIDDTGV